MAILPKMIFLKSDVKRFTVICGSVSKLIRSMIPTRRIERTIVRAMQHIITYSIHLTGNPCVTAKSRSNATYTISRRKRAKRTTSNNAKAVFDLVTPKRQSR